MKRSLKRSHLFGLMVLASFALIMGSNIPGVMILGRVLLLFSTLFHEMGHGLAAMLVGGEFRSISVQWDGSGLTQAFIEPSRLKAAFVAAGGLVGPSIAAAGLFWSARGNDKRLRATTAVLGVALCLIGLLKAASLWAYIFTLGLGPVLLLAAAKWKRGWLEAATVFIAVQLGLSVFTRADYLFTRWAGPNLPSDVANMAEQLFLPFWVWGLLCGAVSLVVLFWGYRCYTKES